MDVEAVTRAFSKHRIANPVVVARDGIEGLAKLRGTDGHDQLAHPRIVLLDLNMPRMSGLEFLAELRSDPALHRTVVFVLTTSKSQNDLVASYDNHVAGYIGKGDVGRGFVNLVELLDRYWRIVELAPPGSR